MAGESAFNEHGERRKIYIGERGERYVMPNELFDDPEVKERLKAADQLAQHLGLKGEPKSS